MRIRNLIHELPSIHIILLYNGRRTKRVTFPADDPFQELWSDFNLQFNYFYTPKHLQGDQNGHRLRF